ncbi:MAG: hypothetical protein IJR83_02630 [Clostridia bacterium]|nr:hypothetical protein [Clostridia bacterium]
MRDVTNRIARLMDRAGFPADAATCFLGVEKRLLRNEPFGNRFEEAVENTRKDPSRFGEGLAAVEAQSGEFGENVFVMSLLYIMHCYLWLEEKYKENNISSTLYWNATRDLVAKCRECMENEGVPGTFVAGWFGRWFNLTRFALGRLQFEYGGVFMDPDLTLPCGYTMKHGGIFLGTHIPSFGPPMTDEVRNETYRQAYEFFRPQFPDGVVVIRTCTWILNPDQLEFLPEDSHLRGFINDFYIDTIHEKQTFGDAWRLVGPYSKLPVEEWPERTTMQRGYKKLLLEGRKTKEGAGLIIVADGKNVTKIPNYFKNK